MSNRRFHHRFVDVWVLFASAALQRTADPENHVRSCTEAGKFADEMLLQFQDRFEEKEEQHDYPDSPTFEHVASTEAEDRGHVASMSPHGGSQDSSFRSKRTQVDKNLEDKGRVSRRELDAELKAQDRQIAELAANQAEIAHAAELERLKSDLSKNDTNSAEMTNAQQGVVGRTVPNGPVGGQPLVEPNFPPADFNNKNPSSTPADVANANAKTNPEIAPAKSEAAKHQTQKIK